MQNTNQKRRGRPPKKQVKALPVSVEKNINNTQFEVLDEDISNSVNPYSQVFEIQDILGKGENPYSFLNSCDNTETQDILKQSFSELVKKNNLPLEYKDFDDVIRHIGDYTEKQSEFNKLYVSKMINAITDIAKVKSMITLSTLTNKALAIFQKVAEDQNLDSLDVMVSSIREIYDWMNKLDELFQKYHIVGTDKQINMLASQGQGYDPEKHLTPTALNALVKQINKQTAEKEAKLDKKEKEGKQNA